jgi:hypothetical protein
MFRIIVTSERYIANHFQISTDNLKSYNKMLRIFRRSPKAC